MQGSLESPQPARTSPPLPIFCFLGFDLQKAGTVWRDHLALPVLAVFTTGMFWRHRVPSLQWPQGFSSRGGLAQHSLQKAGLVGGREHPTQGVLLPPESQGPGPEEPRQLGCRPREQEPRLLPVSPCYRSYFIISSAPTSAIPAPSLPARVLTVVCWSVFNNDSPRGFPDIMNV